MSFADWKDRTAGFKKIDVRGVALRRLRDLGCGRVENPVVKCLQPDMDSFSHCRVPLCPTRGFW